LNCGEFLLIQANLKISIQVNRKNDQTKNGHPIFSFNKFVVLIPSFFTVFQEIKFEMIKRIKNSVSFAAVDVHLFISFQGS
jgi:hypothetical protein